MQQGQRVMSDSNPYAPPSIVDDPPLRQRLWYVEGTRIFVSNGAVLPRIELETGETGEHLVATVKDYTRAPLPWILAMMIAIGSAGFLGKFVPGWTVILGLTLAGMVFTKIGGSFLPRAFSLQTIRFQIGRSPASNRRRIRHMLISVAIIIGTLSLAIAIAFWPSKANGHQVALTCLAVITVGLISAAIYYSVTRRDIRMLSGPYGWVILKGACPLALSALMEIERTIDEAPSVSEPEPPDQMDPQTSHKNGPDLSV